MNDDFFSWRRMKNNDKEIIPVQEMLRDLEDDYAFAAARFLSRNPSKDPIWTLKDRKGGLSTLIINSKSTVLPVFYGKKDMPFPKFLSGFFQLKRIHSIQGLTEEVLFIEDVLKRLGRKVSDTFDYELMSLDKFIFNSELRRTEAGIIPALVLRVPRMTDLDALAPLQASYEHEEVMHRGSVFSPAASRVNLSNIVVGGNILAAEINGCLVGKINVSGVSFTRYLVGGVFVRQDCRSRGIAGKMAAQFISTLIKDGMGVTLFVKKSNIAARKLYTRLGFKVIRDYRITYFYD